MLSRAGVTLVERDLIREPLSEAEIRAVLNGRPASTLYARRGRQNKALGIDPDRLTDDEMIALMASHPTLIRRPTLIVGDEILAGPSKEKLEEIARRQGATAASRGDGLTDR